jgi:Peptidase family M48
MNASRNLSHPDFKRRALFVALGGMMTAMNTSHAANIGQVLEDSQRKRLTEIALPAKDATREAKVRASFERLRLASKPQLPVELLVTSGPVIAETLLGRIVVANEALADLDEGERLFVLAHELGHVMNDLRWAARPQRWRMRMSWRPTPLQPRRSRVWVLVPNRRWRSSSARACSTTPPRTPAPANVWHNSGC